jgi:hypothetical protein
MIGEGANTHEFRRAFHEGIEQLHDLHVAAFAFIGENKPGRIDA